MFKFDLLYNELNLNELLMSEHEFEIEYCSVYQLYF